MLNKVYYHSITWNVLSTLYYRIAYSLYIFCAYKNLNAEDFCLIGTIFSLIYLCITVVDMGLTASISVFFKEATISQSQIIMFAKKQWYAHLLILAVSLLAYMLFAPKSLIGQFLNLPKHYLILYCVITLKELYNKVVKKILQIAYRYHESAIIESISISIFIGAILWASAAKMLSIPFILMAFCIHSFCSTIGLSMRLFVWYNSLMTSSAKVAPINMRRIVTTRLNSYAYHLINTQFSSNVLFPYIAFTYDVGIVSLLKITSTASHTIIMLLEHGICHTGELLFSHTKNNQQASHISRIENHLIVSLAITAIGGLLATILSWPWLSKNITIDTLLCIYLYILLLFSELFFTNKKNLYLINEQFALFFFIKIFSALATLFVMHSMQSIHLAYFLLTLLVIRFSTALAISRAYAGHEGVIKMRNTNRQLHNIKNKTFSQDENLKQPQI